MSFQGLVSHQERAESTGDFRWKGGEQQALEQLESYCSKSGHEIYDDLCEEMNALVMFR